MVDEKAIPGSYFEPREPRLNRQALLAELKSGAVVAGAELSNPVPVLSVRTVRSSASWMAPTSIPGSRRAGRETVESRCGLDRETEGGFHAVYVAKNLA